ncbi:MAG: hypothetical protein KGL52_14025 [Rhodospirillales bacterium]|nr:hypothetical protein [Rhodospirillales bacterium]
MTDFASVAEPQARRLLRNLSRKLPHIVLGPVVLEPLPGHCSYFSIGTIKRGAWHFEQIKSVERALVEEYRTGMTFALVWPQRGAIVLHDTADELHMVRLCHAILPTARTKRLVAQIEAERREAGAPA